MSSPMTASDYSLTLVTRTTFDNEGATTEENRDNRGQQGSASSSRGIPPAPTSPPGIQPRVHEVGPPPARDA